MLHAAINAILIAPGGGLTGLLGYLEAWAELGIPLRLTVFASRRAVLDAVQLVRRDVSVVRFACETSTQERFLKQRFVLGPKLRATRADVVMTTLYSVPRCELPQLVHHRNQWRFLTPTVLHSLRQGLVRCIRDWAGRTALRYAAANAFISDYMRLAAQRYVPESAPRNYTIYNGVSASVIAAARAATDEWAGTPQIIAITADAVHKDNPTLVRMLAELVRRRPGVDWRVRVAGGGRFDQEKRLATELGVAERIKWMGFTPVDELDPLLRRSVCLAFTSRLEGFGNPLIEAMARRCPPVACRCTATPEVVGDAGLLVEPGNATQFADAVLRLFEDQRLRRRLADEGLARLPRFKWQDSARKMFGLFEKIAH